MAYFPMFIELKHRKCLVIGGGPVAFRKAETLKDFGADVSVVAPNILPQILAMDGVFCLEKMFEEEDAAGFTFIVAATDDKKLNRHISQIHKSPYRSVQHYHYRIARWHQPPPDALFRCAATCCRMRK